MAHQGSYMAVAVTAVVMGATSSAAAMESDAQPTAVVRVDNKAAVPAGELQLAEARVADVFRRIGARIIWVDTETAIAEELRASYTVVIMAASRWHGDVGPKRLVDDMLGLAAPAIRRAYVYYDRVVATDIGSRRSIGSILGDVIAHELGHLLLPTTSHSFTGIMRPSVSVSPSIVTFDGAQARYIRSRLQQTPR